MIRRIAIAVALVFALGGCATYDSAYNAGYRDGSYGGAYDGGYYAASTDGYGDYYYDRPQVAVSNYYAGGYGPYAGFGFGFATWPFDFGFGPGFGYDPWFYGPWYPYGWHRPWPEHAHPEFARAHRFDDGSHGGNRNHGNYMRPHNGP